MENVVQFYVDDTSPTIHYSPFRDTLSTPNLSAGWNPYFNLSGFAASIGEVGNGTSLHITSLDGASLAFQWRGTGIQLQGNATLASYSVIIDGQSVSTDSDSQAGGNILVNIEGLEDATHNITLTAQIPTGQNPPNSSMLVFDKAIITSSPIPVSSNVSFRQDTIVDNDIAFLGRWSFETAPTGASLHSSNNSGDRAMAAFNGTAFLIQGMTSPDAANYSITLDNVTTSLSARSSFTDYESLLFFASGLDPNAMHSVEVRNQDGGELSLLVGGFSTFVSYNASSSPTSSPTSSPSLAGATGSMSFPKGTIAAFILAGILAFLLCGGALFFFLWYRPRRRRRRQQEHHFVTTELEENPKASRTLNITSGDVNYSKGADLEEPSPISPADNNRSSGMSGFARWRREAVRGSFGGVSLPLHFRHSGSAEEKNPSTIEERPRSELSDPPSSDSSAKRKARAKSKGKARQITGRSWSPSFTLDLPLQQQRQRQSAGPTSPRITSMGHLSSFIAAEPSPQDLRNPAPPSYAVSISNRNSTQDSNSNHNSNSISHTNSASNPSAGIPSGPRSVSYSPVNASYPRTHLRENSHGFLLHEGEPSSDPDSPEGAYAHQQLTAPEVIPMRPLTRYDGGSLTTEDDSCITEPSAMRQVLRSLSPRTSEAPQRQSQWHEDRTRDSLLVSPSAESPTGHTSPEPEPGDESRAGLRIKPLPRPPTSSSSEDDVVEVKDGVFLSVRTTSPFHVDFDSRSARMATTSEESTDAPYASAISSGKPSRQSSGALRRLPDPPITTTRIPEFVQGTSRLPFRLTPIALPSPLTLSSPQSPPKQPSDGNSDGVTSFLDLTVSREGSMRSRSIFTASDQEKPINEGGRLSLPGLVEPRSRWSNTTVPSIATNLPPAPANDSSGESHKISPSEARSTDSSTFPIAVQVNIPPSPHHVMDYNLPQARQSRTSRVSGFTQAGDHLHIHPSIENMESPTESIPMSVSDLHFRHSDSEELSSRRNTVEGPTHPPLPGSFTDEYRSKPFDPSIIVNRVLGLPSPIPISAEHSRSGSTAVETHSFSATPQRPSNNTSNEQLAPSNISGHPFS